MYTGNSRINECGALVTANSNFRIHGGKVVRPCCDRIADPEMLRRMPVRYLFALFVLLLNSGFAAATTDLDPDPAFGWSNGSNFDVLNYDDRGLRVYVNRLSAPPLLITRYYLLSAHANGDGTTNAYVIRTDAEGSYQALDADVTTPIGDLRDVAYDPASGRAYFFGGAVISGGFGADMYVQCVDSATISGDCSGWPAGSGVRIAFDLGGTQNDVATAAVVDPDGFLFVGGYATTATGYDIALAKLHLDSGELDATFGPGGGKLSYNISDRMTGVDHNVFAMALSSTNTHGGKNLYLGGDVKRLAGDYDGFILAVNPTLATSASFRVDYEADNTGNKDDLVSALTVMKDGRVAFAGYSETDQSGFPALLIGRLAIEGLEGDFETCNDKQICVKDEGSGVDGVRNVFPTAIAERPGNHDLVVAMRGEQARVAPPGPFVPYQIVEQYSTQGAVLHARRVIGYPSPQGQTTTGFASGGMQVSATDIVLTGTVTQQDDKTNETFYFDSVTRLLANDSIFAGGFQDESE